MPRPRQWGSEGGGVLLYRDPCKPGPLDHITGEKCCSFKPVLTLLSQQSVLLLAAGVLGPFSSLLALLS
jgi:hypothetical protein